MTAAFQANAFQSDAFQEGAAPVVVPVNQGLLMRMKPVPYRGPVTSARVITQAAIATATRKFNRKRAEEEWLLGLITEAQYLEAA